MNNRSLRYAFILFHCTLAAVVFFESVTTMLHAVHAHDGSPLRSHLVWFAGLEAVAAVLFLVPKTLRIGGALLLLIFAVAVVIHGIRAELTLLVYASGAILMIVRGSAFT